MDKFTTFPIITQDNWVSTTNVIVTGELIPIKYRGMMAKFRLSSVSVVCLVLLHICGCLGVAEDNEVEATETDSLRWKREEGGSAPVVLGAPPPQPKCITPQGPCACQTDRGLIDLSAIDNKDGTKPFFDNIQADGNTYNFNPCTPYSTNRCNQAAMCQCYSQFYCSVIGSHASAKFQNDPSTQQLSISYPTGGFYSSVVILVCDPSKEGTVIVTSTQNPYKFTLTSKHACPKSGSGSMSVGTILIIVFFSIVFVYLIGGVLYMHFAKGAQGVEKIPNSTFWIGVPGLVKDGGTFIVQSVKGGGGGKSTYEQL